MYHPTNCLACYSDCLLPYLDLGSQPLANNYHKGIELETYPLGVSVCTRCYHSQLTTMADPGLMFDEYIYVSGTSRTLTEYFHTLCNEIMTNWREATSKLQYAKVYTYTPPKVLEVACNDGTLLQMFKDKGCKVLGVDPASNLKELCLQKGLPVIDKYWGMEVARHMTERFDLVIAVNVLPHVPNPYDFLQACKHVLAPGGKIIIQSSQCDMFINNEFDAIYHEHHSYFTVNSFRTLVDRVSLRIAHARKVPIHSMSFVWELEPSTFSGEWWEVPIEEHDSTLVELLHKDMANGLLGRNLYHRFAANTEEIKRNMLDIQRKCKQDGIKMVGYGASAKGNTMMNYIGITLDYIVDDNPLKWGYLTPGTNIPIVAPDKLREDSSEKLAIVCLAWNFREEIIKKAKACRVGKSDAFIFYVPNVQIWEEVR